MNTQQKPKGLCPDCKVMVVLSADGTIRHHDRKVINPHPTPQGLPADHGFLYHVLAKCPGGRKQPECNCHGLSHRNDCLNWRLPL